HFLIGGWWISGGQRWRNPGPGDGGSVPLPPPVWNQRRACGIGFGGRGGFGARASTWEGRIGGRGSMLTVLRVHLPSEIPVVGCEVTPYVLLRWPDGSISNDDVPESAPLNGYCMRYKWYRNLGDQKVAVCSVHPTEQATLQCLVCLKEKVPIAKSYHCTPRCFSDAWQHHRSLHERAKKAVNENGTDEEEVFGRFNSGGSGSFNSGLSGIAPNLLQSPGLNNGPISVYPTTVADKSGEAWSEVARSRTYTPTADDINHVLKFECVAVDVETRIPVGNVNTVLTSRVIPAPSPTPRRMVPVNGDLLGQLDLDGQTSSGTFSVLSYNILSDAYATSEAYSYCPTWALSWPYRRQNLLREIIGYHADILCLQEVHIPNLIFLIDLANTHISVHHEHKDVKLWQVFVLSCSIFCLLDEENLRKNTAIPSPEWSSDHIALLAEFRCKPRIRR
ncbi:hypothetical protein GW17_00032576, partial [Ensete ventricosum]